MKTNNIPGYFSLHESTSDMMLGEVSHWKPRWAQKENDLERKFTTRNGNDTGNTRSNTRNSTRANTHASLYNGILTAQYVNSTVYCAIYESKTFSPIVGICMVDPHTSILKVTEISDSPTFVRTIHKLSVHSNVSSLELALPVSYQRKNSNFIKILEANLPRHVSLSYIPDALFRTNNISLEFLCKSVKGCERDAFRIELSHKKFGFAAACACIAYLSSLPDHTFIHENFNVKYDSAEDSMFISTSAIENLELVTSNSLNKKYKKLSVFDFLNSTVTKMGERLLRNNIIQPLTGRTSLVLRHEAVKELIANEDITNDVRYEMKNLVDLDNLFSYLCKKFKTNLDQVDQQKINFILLLKSTLEITKNVRELLNKLECKLVKEIIKVFENEDLDSVLNLISEYINEDCIWVSKPVELRNQKCYAVKIGHNGILDASRQLYKSLVDEILKIIEDLREKHNIPLENKYEKTRGFYIFIKEFDIDSMDIIADSPFINCTQKANNIECTTMDIVKINLRIDSVLNEIFLMTEDTIEKLIGSCRKFVSSFFLISEAFSLLDIICAFAKVSTRSQYSVYSCPEFEDKNTIFKNSRNPLLEHKYTMDKKSNDLVVSNDFTIVFDTSRIQIISGPNMSGKSIYIKQLAINVIMAQIGMFVPAEFASLRIFKSLFTRISNDVTEPNMSTFSMELVEMSFILQNADPDSLIIIDELGRGTGYKDGISICISMLEKIRKMKSVCLFVTHFVCIPKIFQNKPGVFELHLGVSNDGVINNIFKIQPGINWVSGFGIKIIEDKKLFPEDVIKYAKLLSNKLKVSKNSTVTNSKSCTRASEQNKLILNSYEMLQHIVHNVPDSELFHALAALENEFINKYKTADENLQEIPEVADVLLEELVVKSSKTTHNPSVTNSNSLLDFGYLSK